MSDLHAAELDQQELAKVNPEIAGKCLTKICGSRGFLDSPRSSRFLEFLVSETLAGRKNSLKESVIAIDVFEKSTDFDPRLDSTVRTGANRLRSKLRAYYAVEGVSDEIQIAVAEGQYAPEFIVRSTAKAEHSNIDPAAEQPSVTPVSPPLEKPARHPSSRFSLVLAATVLATTIICCLFLLNVYRKNLSKHAGTAVAPQTRKAGASYAPERTQREWQRLRRSVAIVGFKDLSAKKNTAWIAPALSEMLYTEISASNKLRAIPNGDMARTMLELGLDDRENLKPSQMDKIRITLGADFILLGTYVDLANERDGEIRIDVRILDTSTGETLTSIRESGTESTLFQMVLHAGASIREKLASEELSASEFGHLRASFPMNVKAENLYSQGVEKLHQGDAAAAGSFLKKAAIADPNFALAHLALADAWLASGYERDAAEEANKAARLSSGLFQEEHLWIQGRRSEIEKNWSEATEVYRALWMVFPDNLEYGLRLTKALAAAGRGDEAFATIAKMHTLPFPLGQDPRIDAGEASTAEALGNFKREEKAAARAAEGSRARGSWLLAASAQLQECWALYNLGESKRALALARQAQGTFATAHDQAGEAQALKDIGDILDDGGDHADARTSYEAALVRFRGVGYQTAVAVTSNNLAYAIKYQGDINGAKRMFEESLSTCHKIRDDHRAALPLNGIGGILWRQGDLSGARTMYEQAFAIFTKYKDKLHAATVLSNIGLVLSDQGDLFNARSKMEQSLKMLREIDDKPEIARVVGNLGQMLLKHGDLAGAEKRFQEHLAIGEKISDDRQVAYAAQEQGDLLTMRGDLKTAEAKYREALEIRVKLGEMGTAAETRLGLAEVLLERGQPVAAETLARAAEQEFRKEQETDQSATASATIARCLLNEGKTAEALVTAESIPRVSDRYVQLGIDVTSARAVASTGRTADAIQKLNIAVATAAKYDYQPHVFEARLALAEIDAKTGGSKAPREFADLEKQAKFRGFGLIAGKAESVRMNQKRARARGSIR